MRSEIIYQRAAARFGLPSVGALVRALWINRWLAWEMAKRELQAVNKGTILGFGWLVLRPAIQMAAYVIIVSFIFSVRSPGGGHFSYALFMLGGMAPWQFTTRVLEDAPSLIRSRIDTLKQVVYPLEILPITSLVMAAVGPTVLLALYIIVGAISGQLHWTLLLLPVPVAILAALLLGSSWALMVIGLVFVDLREMIGVLFGLIIYMSPVVLSQKMVPATIWRFILLNPLSHIIICFRDVYQAEFHPWSWAIFSGMTAFALVIGIFALASAKQIFSEYA